MCVCVGVQVLKLQSEIADKMKSAEEAGESGEVDTAQDLMDKVEVSEWTRRQGTLQREGGDRHYTRTPEAPGR